MTCIGRCIGEAEPTKVEFVSKEMPRVGEYVTLDYDGKNVLGIIDAMVRGNIALNCDIFDPSVVAKIKQIEGDEYYIKGIIRILGDVSNKMKIPRTPPAPGTEVMKADSEILAKIFGHEEGMVEIGKLLTESNVPVFVDINKMINKHTAILSITGFGKSNTVATITNEIMKKEGAVLIFDMHSEYVNTEFPQGEKNIIKPMINPMELSMDEFAKLCNITHDAYVQRRYFRKAYKKIKYEFRQSGGTMKKEDFVKNIISTLESKRNEDGVGKSDITSITAAQNKLEEFEEKYEHMIDFFTSDIISRLELGKINIIDFGQTDDKTTDIIVSHCLRRILQSRKEHLRTGKGMSFPIFVVLEEAHILASSKETTASKYYLGKIGREGRKFGVGMCLVSQRPKALDVDTLSQVNNMIILKIVEPSDQRHIQSASECLSNEFISQLPSLNVGEAIVIGPMIKIPALVKISSFEGKLVGRDPDVIAEWSKAKEKLEQRRKDAIAMSSLEKTEKLNSAIKTAQEKINPYRS